MSSQCARWCGILAILFLAADWPQWRGAERTGQSPGNPWPETLSADTLKQVWRVPLAPSYSGPLIVGRRVIITETRDAKTEVVSCWNLETGERAWQTEWEGALKVPFFAASNGDWIRGTPACDGKLVFVPGMRDVLTAVDLETGEKRWSVDFVARFKSPVPAFGFVSSPLLEGDYLYVQAGAAVIKLRKDSGEILWRSLEDGGGMWGSAFSSPVSAEFGGVRQLIVQTRDKLAGLDPETGRTLWEQKVPAFRGMNILTPTAWNDRVFMSSYGGKSLLFAVERDGSAWKTSEVWNQKTQGYMSSPLLQGDHVYLHLRNQRVTCINLTTGKETWTTQPFGKYWSMAARGDKALALDERGELHLFRLNPEKFEPLGVLKLNSDDSWAHLASSDDWVVVRELKAVTAYRWSR